MSLEASGDLPDLALDRMRPSQALDNIIGKALNCTGARGNIEIRAEVEGGQTLVIAIADDGTGISADLPHVFDRFSTVPTSPAAWK